jgi:hypothetical protein
MLLERAEQAQNIPFEHLSPRQSLRASVVGSLWVDSTTLARQGEGCMRKGSLAVSLLNSVVQTAYLLRKRASYSG